MADANLLKCVVVTPERAVVDEVADYVALPMYDGELGVCPGRTPLIGKLGSGELRIRKGEKTLSYYLDSGFAQVRSNVVTVLTNRAVLASEINVQAARDVLAQSGKLALTLEEQEAEFQKQERARAQLRVWDRQGG